ncbi:hypothetical protein AB0395_10935 [Streptosporangium sp. NPDC051023]|uniref:hypothetical protein n=1 Tax=Streptosporangium sp. NPDC051023 TaxID=3155410 RepID=UPI00344DD35A
MGNSKAAACERGTGDDQEHQFIHLVRLAWDLRGLGLEISVELPRGAEPYVVVRRMSGPLRVAATKHDQGWVFSWGRGPDRQAPALDAEVPHRIRQVAR